MKHLLVLLLATVCMAGCGKGGSTIEGTVSFTDGGPLTKGVISITGNGGGYQAPIGADGTFTLTGVVEGDYSVAITGAMDSAPDLGMNYDDKGQYVAPKAAEPKSLIKADYSDPSKSGLTLKVPGDYNLKVDKAG